MDEPRDEQWYSVRCLIRFPASDAARQHYEERITLWRATAFNEAIARAEADVIDYTDGLSAEYAELAQCFHLAIGGDVGDAAEVFSLTRDSDLDPAEYVDRFFDTGAEHQGRVSGST
jgi:hypothetical protein